MQVRSATTQSILGKMLIHFPSEEQRILFLRNRFLMFLKGEQGKAFSLEQLIRAFALEYKYYSEASKAVNELIDNRKFGIKQTHDRTKVIYPREGQYV